MTGKSKIAHILALSVATVLPSAANADDADWANRTAGSGVTMSTNFPTADHVFDFIRDDPSHYAHETAIKRSGAGALKIVLLASEDTAGFDWWRFLDDSMVPFGSAESNLRDEYWLSYSVYIPADYYNWVFKMTNGGAKKFSITSGHPWDSVHPITRAAINFPTGTGVRRTGSSVSNEVVITDLAQTMSFSLYIKNQDGTASTQNSVSGELCSRYDFWYSNAVDVGPQSNTPKAWPGDQRSQACRDLVAQYGSHYSYLNLDGHGGPQQGMSRLTQAQPHPDPIAAGPRFEIGWNTILYHIKFPSQWTARDGTVEAWMAHPGDLAWKKVFEKFDVTGKDPKAIENGISLNNGVDGYFHWGLWLTPFRTGGLAEANRPDTFLVYDEVIVSTQPIPAPNTPADVLAPVAPTGLAVD